MKVKIEGVVLTMYDSRTKLSEQVTQVKITLKSLYMTPSFRNVRLSEAPSYGKHILDYDPHSRVRHYTCTREGGC